jgi:hypothetical protein
LLQQLFEDHVKDRSTQTNINTTDRVSVTPNLDNPPTRWTYQSIEEYESLYEQLCKIDVIIDTGATCHCFPIKPIFNTYTHITSGTRNISYADGSSSDVAGIGDTCLLTNVLHVPNMKLGIISVSMLDKAGYHSMFSDNKVIVMNANTQQVLLTGTLLRGLYQLDDIYIRAMADNQCNYPMDSNDGAVNQKASRHVQSGIKRRKCEYDARIRSEEYMKRFADDESNDLDYESETSVTLGSEDTWSDNEQYNESVVDDKILKGLMNTSIEKGVKGKLRLENSSDNLLMQLHKRYGQLRGVKLKTCLQIKNN